MDAYKKVVHSVTTMRLYPTLSLSRGRRDRRPQCAARYISQQQPLYAENGHRRGHFAVHVCEHVFVHTIRT